MRTFGPLFLCLLFSLRAPSASAETITIAAAANLRPAMEEVVKRFKIAHRGDEVILVFGSSGKAHAQIQQGAPYDLFFSADTALPQDLVNKGYAASEVKFYATGRLVLWRTNRSAPITLKDLTAASIKRIAIANPKHAPYGKRAEEALRKMGLWEEVKPKLVYGEDIMQTAQFVQTGNVQVGIIALSLALNPQLAKRGSYWLIPDTLHQPLEQGYVILKHAAHKGLAHKFAAFISDHATRKVMTKYGFTLPGGMRTPDEAGKRP
jgi:molybdate transport system substrate-binding protein